MEKTTYSIYHIGTTGTSYLLYTGTDPVESTIKAIEILDHFRKDIELQVRVNDRSRRTSAPELVSKEMDDTGYIIRGEDNFTESGSPNESIIESIAEYFEIDSIIGKKFDTPWGTATISKWRGGYIFEATQDPVEKYDESMGFVPTGFNLDIRKITLI